MVDTEMPTPDEPDAQQGPRRLPAARRRKQLTDVALELFGAGSYHATSMDDIAERAGVTKPVLYQHFPSKSQLYMELIKTVGDELLSAVAGAADEAEPSERVRAGFEAYFRFVAARTDAFRLLFGGGARQDEFADAIHEVEAAIAETIGELIEVDLPPDHRELLGYAIVGLAEVTSRQWVLRHEEAGDPTGGLDPDEGGVLAGRLSDLVWAGLRALPGLPPAREMRAQA